MKPNAPQSKKIYRSNERVSKILQRKSSQTPLKAVPSRGSVHQDSKKETPPIELFQKEGCPYSHAVRNYLSSLGVDFIARNVSEHNDLKHHQLVLAGGKNQIPFMVDHRTGIKLYESDAIISYLEKEYGKPATSRSMRILQTLELRLRSQAERLQWAVKAPVESLQSFNEEAREILTNTTDILKSTFAGMKTAFTEPSAKEKAEEGFDRKKRHSEEATETEYARKFARKNASGTRQKMTA